MNTNLIIQDHPMDLDVILKKDDAMKRLRFIDLFAGLGGFHLALKTLGHECVFACEVNDDLAALYEKNFGIRPHGDIRKLNISSVPEHDILCAGFPCQPFSKAGDQQGFDCPQWGDLIDYAIRILRTHKPRYFIIENVPDLPGKPDLVFASAKVVIFCDGDFWHGRNWKKLKQELRGRKNSEYWIPKIAANIHRDLLQKKNLSNAGWRVVRLWETDILKDPAAAAATVKAIVKGA